MNIWWFKYNNLHLHNNDKQRIMANLLTRKEAIKIATEVSGKTCQSTVLTMISDCGQKKVPQPAQKIYGYELIDLLGGVELMLFVGGESVFYDTCYNFSKG